MRTDDAFFNNVFIGIPLIFFILLKLISKLFHLDYILSVDIIIVSDIITVFYLLYIIVFEPPGWSKYEQRAIDDKKYPLYSIIMVMGIILIVISNGLEVYWLTIITHLWLILAIFLAI